ncbi:hypothetical protein L6R52_37045 [Myxococcota bacterium]|nr:hypothetical protein [Myxococcota bacterium]
MRTLVRGDAIADIRRELLRLVDDEHSVCEVAAEKGILCRGFRQFSDEELARRYDWISKRRHPKTREELETLANRWQLARQFVLDQRIACDVQLEDRDTCDGWDTFSNRMIERYYRELCGEDVTVRDDAAVHQRTFR